MLSTLTDPTQNQQSSVHPPIHKVLNAVPYIITFALLSKQKKKKCVTIITTLCHLIVLLCWPTATAAVSTPPSFPPLEFPPPSRGGLLRVLP